MASSDSQRTPRQVASLQVAWRYGGEEFLVVLNNCDPAFALARAEEIRNTIAQRPVQTSPGPVPLTISLGMLLSHEWGTRTAEELLHEADRALYAAKRADRNCLKVASTDAASGWSELPVDSPPNRAEDNFERYSTGNSLVPVILVALRF